MAHISEEFERMSAQEYEMLEWGTIGAVETLRRKNGRGFRVDSTEALWRVQPHPGHSTYDTLKSSLSPDVFAEFRFLWNQFYHSESSQFVEQPSIRPLSREFDDVSNFSRHLDDLNIAFEIVAGEVRNGLWVASMRLTDVSFEGEQVIRLGQMQGFVQTTDGLTCPRIEPVVSLDDETSLLPEDASLQGIAIKP